ncbi:MAG: hypothetical protein QOI44_1315 [Actinomycetota bacterium]|nr:hypothetical protein [Actinomycetota bacterium]
MDTMRAIVLDAPGPPDALTVRELPVPTPASGWVLIEVKAFGLNRSEATSASTQPGMRDGSANARRASRSGSRMKPALITLSASAS